MTTTTILDRFKVRGGAAAALASTNEVPLDREIELAKDVRNFKVGDGSTHFNDLPWFLAPWTTASGTNTITATYTDKPVFFDGMLVRLRAAGANTGAATFNPNGLGALDINKQGGTPLVAGDIAAADHELLLVYHDDGSPWWELLNPATASGSGSGAMEYVGSSTVAGSAASSLAMSGLDLATDQVYVLYFKFDNATGSSSTISLYFNSDTTATNYYAQLLESDGASGLDARTNSARVAILDPNETFTGRIEIFTDLDGKARARVYGTRGSPSVALIFDVALSWTSNANITGLTFSASVLNSLAIGSTFKLFKVHS